MKIVLATGIFPPEIGGPATYVRGLAHELVTRGEDVVVLTYGQKQGAEHVDGYTIVRVDKQGGPCGRWLRYRSALRFHGEHADYVCAFTSISVGIPMLIAGLKNPTTILRLGGEFFWERYTDGGGGMTLREWYASRFGFWRILNRMIMGTILRSFDRLVYSTEFQRKIHATFYNKLPPSIVEANAMPEGIVVTHTPRIPFRLLFMGRFVRFKNIPALIDSLLLLPDVNLTIIGEGPLEQELKSRVKNAGLSDRVSFQSIVSGDAKRRAFDAHDLLVIPSLTDISPNTALEARAVCLPVLLTEETGLPAVEGIHVRLLRSPEQIATAIREMIKKYPSLKQGTSMHSYRNISDVLFPPVSS